MAKGNAMQSYHAEKSQRQHRRRALLATVLVHTVLIIALFRGQSDEAGSVLDQLQELWAGPSAESPQP